MGHLTPFDKALLLILVALWAVCFTLSVKSQIDGRGILHIGLSVADGDSDPVLTGEYGVPYASDPLVAAGLRAGDRLVRLGSEDLDATCRALSVGVGIATGDAFVGNIQAVDRMIWSAIGNTTNLAARLQSLTRDLDASLVIDRETFERARHAAADFEERPGVSIRGRRETQDLYTLSIEPGSSAGASPARS